MEREEEDSSLREHPHLLHLPLPTGFVTNRESAGVRSNECDGLAEQARRDPQASDDYDRKVLHFGTWCFQEWREVRTAESTDAQAWKRQRPSRPYWQPWVVFSGLKHVRTG
jgi:hypothetical protein